MEGDLRFDRFTLRPATRELLDGGQALAIGARAFDLLFALADARGRVVTRDELLDRVWRGVVVGDENLKVQVMALRKLIGAPAVVTVPGRGYRLAPSVHEPAAPVTVAPVATALFGREAALQHVQAA